MRQRLPMTFCAWAILLLAFAAGPASAGEEIAKVPVETFELANGMRFLAVTRPELVTVSAGWVAHVGSSNERPGITGLSHFFEHMMFKGSHTIGTRDIEADLEIIAEQEELQEKIRAEHARQRERWRLGEIDDPFKDENRPPELVELERRFQELVEKQRELIVKDEFDEIYTEEGGSGMNAFTTEDLTGYFITVPANKLELWFWMESDRLRNPVFREFYSERDVVYEERRQSLESTPTGEFDEEFNALFWQSHPYSWSVVGWPSDLESYTKAQADDYYATYYAPNNLTGVLVGNFDLGEAKALAERYFGRLERGKTKPPDVITMEMEQKAEKRMRAECDCQPQVEVRYHTVPFRHKDAYALDVLAGLMRGQSGRLYKKMILGDEIASRAFSGQRSMKWAGYFYFFGETKGEATPEQLEASWYAELERLRSEPIPAEELQKVKNQITASAFRRLENPMGLLFQLVFYDGMGDWTYLNMWAEKTLAVTAADVKRVAETYFQPENRSVALYYRKAGTQAEELPPELAELPDQMRQMVQMQLQQIRQIEEPAKIEEALTQMETQKANMPPPLRKVLPLMEKALRERLEALKAKEGGDS